MFFQPFCSIAQAAWCSDTHEHNHPAEHGAGVELMGGYSAHAAAGWLTRKTGKNTPSLLEKVFLEKLYLAVPFHLS